MNLNIKWYHAVAIGVAFWGVLIGMNWEAMVYPEACLQDKKQHAKQIAENLQQRATSYNRTRSFLVPAALPTGIKAAAPVLIHEVSELPFDPMGYVPAKGVAAAHIGKQFTAQARIAVSDDPDLGSNVAVEFALSPSESENVPPSQRHSRLVFVDTDFLTGVQTQFLKEYCGEFLSLCEGVVTLLVSRDIQSPGSELTYQLVGADLLEVNARVWAQREADEWLDRASAQCPQRKKPRRQGNT